MPKWICKGIDITAVFSTFCYRIAGFLIIGTGCIGFLRHDSWMDIVMVVVGIVMEMALKEFDIDLGKFISFDTKKKTGGR